MKAVVCTQAETAGGLNSKIPELTTWHQLADAMVRMTAHAFSEDGQLHRCDSGTGRWTKNSFLWTRIHWRLADVHSLPVDLQEGMRRAGNFSAWTLTMRTLLARPPCCWPCVDTKGGRKRKDFLTLVGDLWKKLEIAMNHAELDVAFCLFFCRQVMDAVKAEDCGGMSFTPSLSPNSSLSSSGDALAPVQYFTGRVRYRSQGRVPDERYHNRATHQQRSSVLLDRPLEAARGDLPNPSAKRRAQ
jgi:hypothetical protein